MFFILQKEEKYVDNLEIFVLKEILDRQKFVHQYTFMTLKEMENILETNLKLNIKEVVPVGTIQFVEAYLKQVHGIKSMNPIEVPNVLRHDKYLKRKYSIIERNQLPKQGYYFTKYVSGLKEFTHTGTTEDFRREKGYLIKDGFYQLSEVVSFLSEYRVFVSQDDMQAIQFYDGEPTVLPNEKDIELLQEMVARYTLDNTRPQAYSLDVGIIKDRGLTVIECHPHTSLGLYGYYGNTLPYSYKFGLDWYIKHNTPIAAFDNFHTFKKD